MVTVLQLHSRRLARGVLAGLSALAAASPASATRITNSGSIEPDGHHSFVQCGDQRTFIQDDVYASDVRHFPGASVDVVMSQCFGGGFVDDMINEMGPDAPPARQKNFTISTSSNWNESSFSSTDRTFFGGNLKGLDNFNRAWVDSTTAIDTGMSAHFINATSGRATAPVIVRDPYAVGGSKRTTKFFETPQYASPDPADPGAAHPNDTRSISAPEGVREYAVLVAWDRVEDRHDANIDRVYEMLTNEYNIPVSNIVILEGTHARGDRTAAFSNLSLSDHFIDGPLTLDNWRDAVNGRLFTDGDGRTGRNGGTNVPGANDRLLIYNTGHGGNLGRNAVRPTRGGDGTLDYTITEPGVFNTARADITAAGGDEADSDPDGTSVLQLSTRRLLAPSTSIYIDNTLVGSPTLTTDPNVEIDISSLLGETTYSYQLRFNHSLLEAATDISVGLANTLDSDPSGDLLAALTLQGGDQMFVGIVPEPGMLGLLLLLLSLVERRASVRRHIPELR